MNVLFAHPTGNSCVYEILNALQAEDLLSEFFTGFYYHENSQAAQLVNSLPKKISQPLLREMMRRNHSALDDKLIQSVSIPDIIYTLCGKSKRLRPYMPVISRARNAVYDRITAREVKRKKPRFTIGYDSSSLKTLEAAKQVGSVAILSQCIGHMARWKAICELESKKHPDFFGIRNIKTFEQRLERCTREALIADHIIAPSEYVRDTLLEIGVDEPNISVVPFGVNTEMFKPKEHSNDGKFRILFVGQLSLRKGLIYLLEAFKEANLPDAELTLVGKIAGDDSWFSKYKHLFTHVQNVPYNQVVQHFQQADIFVFPSLHEGMAMASHEALSCGLPVIVTPNTGSVARDGIEGFVVPVRDTRAITEKMMLLHNDRKLREKMALAARNRALEFTWEAHRKNLVAVIEKLAS